MDYDFSRLNTRSFEQLIQALSTSVIGPGVNIFGDGPDGGREATFDGSTGFPFPHAAWEGYGVIQAKFRQRSQDKDGDWALSELKKELDKFADTSRGLKAPEFYIFATNVVLTPVQNTGSKDKVTALLERYKSLLKIKDYRIWDRDQLSALLDSQESIRTAYAAWITPGDVLTAILDKLKTKNLDFSKVMLNFIQKELRSEQFVSLGQAGNSGADEIPLACVFVDLPIKTESSTIDHFTPKHLKLPHSRHNSSPKELKAIKTLITVSGQRLDNESNKPCLQLQFSIPPPTFGRIVFIGGPGQGKSTLTQFFCQLNRVALLQNSNKSLLPETLSLCNIIKTQCAQEHIEIPSIARFPIRIELNRFAADLARGLTTSLFDYILKRIKDRSERDILPEDLRTWLSNYPWLLALDGLDEVPASSNRSQVLSKINDFLVDAHECNADLLLIATSRPQGYNDEFSPQFYKHYSLSSLTPTSALNYAKRLIIQRCKNNRDKEDLLLERLTRASREVATARLMQSPLQVTIMALLVETLGEPPKERWRLFNEYYQVINRREKERAIPAAALLNKFQADIDAIHQTVGFTLQTQSEKKGGTDSLLPTDKFSDIVKSRLQSEGHDGDTLKQLNNDIISAALERLVFLVAPQHNKIGFEIRSLQEFMAAQCLMTGTDSNVLINLRKIAHSVHWRNVFLFAAGRCFHDKQHLRGDLYIICCALNEPSIEQHHSELEKITLAGSTLAVDILEDGAVNNQPAQYILYLRLSMRLLELPPSANLLRLAGIYKSSSEEFYIENIKLKLDDTVHERTLGAWQVLLQLVAKNIAWAKDIANEYWPKDHYKAAEIVNATTGVDFSKWLANKIVTSTVNSPLDKEFAWLENPSTTKNEILECAPEWFNKIITSRNKKNIIHTNLANVSNAFKFTFTDHHPDTFINYTPSDNINPGWEWLCRAINFHSFPTKENLSAILYELFSLRTQGQGVNLRGWESTLYWPLSCCISSARTIPDLKIYSDAALRGELGDTDTWSKASTRLKAIPLSTENIEYDFPNGLPFDSSVAYSGYPKGNIRMTLSHDTTIGTLSEKIFDIWRNLPKCQALPHMTQALIFALDITHNDKAAFPIENHLEKFIDSIDSGWVNLGFIDLISEQSWQENKLTTTLDFIGKNLNPFISRTRIDTAKKIERIIQSKSNNEGCSYLLSLYCTSGYTASDTTPTHIMFSSPRSNIASATIELSKEGLTISNAQFLAKTLARLAKTHEKSIKIIIRNIAENNNKAKNTKYFLTSLYSHLPNHAWQLKKQTIDAIQLLQNRNLSGL